jgi:hypothetical protein
MEQATFGPLSPPSSVTSTTCTIQEMVLAYTPAGTADPMTEEAYSMLIPKLWNTHLDPQSVAHWMHCRQRINLIFVALILADLQVVTDLQQKKNFISDSFWCPGVALH